jgi:putative phosphoesterase
MKYGVFSDIHSNLEALEAVLEALKKEKVDRYLCAGDIVGYAANPRECLKIVKDLDCPTVCGNHDRAVTGMLDYSGFNDAVRAAVEWTKVNLNDWEKNYLRSLPLVYEEGNITMVHGSLDKPEEFEYVLNEEVAVRTVKLCKTKICFIGHTHQPFEYYRGMKLLVNDGSVGQPRDGDPRAAYCIFDSETGQVRIKKVEYDIRSAADKIVAAGLPEYFAARLTEGT